MARENQNLKFKRIKAGWYVAQNNERFLHIRRCCDTYPHWGWDCFNSDEEHTFCRYQMICGGLADLHEAKTACQDYVAFGLAMRASP
jgi:hypothetical protein